jgi:hypothetical protein
MFMKVGKTEEQIKEWFEKTKSKAKNPFTVISDPDEVVITKSTKKVPKTNAGVWAEWDVPSSSLAFDERQRYEWFCAGYLAYYDIVTRSGASDHVVSFKWDLKKKRVKVFINPPPQEGVKNSDVNPAAGFTSDPPKPPPPPPPPMG